MLQKVYPSFNLGVSHTNLVSHSVCNHSSFNMASQKKSEVWNFFEEIHEEKVRCNLCQTVLSYKGKTTKSMWNHLKGKHPHAMADNKDTILHKFGPSPRQTSMTSYTSFAKPVKFQGRNRRNATKPQLWCSFTMLIFMKIIIFSCNNLFFLMFYAYVSFFLGMCSRFKTTWHVCNPSL